MAIESEDCIDRRELLIALMEYHNDSDMPTYWHRGVADAIEIVRNFPSVVPKDHIGESTEMFGEWVESEIPNELYVCSECGGACWSYDWDRTIVKSFYCPNCGAKMKG